MTVVVHTRSRVYGPFVDANEAMAWVLLARTSISLAEHPLTPMHVDDPQHVVGAGWQNERRLRDINGNAVSQAEFDRSMNYTGGSDRRS